MKYNKNVHIGNLIHERLRQQGMSYARLARLINCDRTTVYSIVRSKSIDTDRLIRISEALDYDFISIYTDNTASAKRMRLNIDRKDLCRLSQMGIEEISIEIRRLPQREASRPNRNTSAESADTPTEESI